ncbi:peptidoglycan DD-metalloendopeptidase family protein [Bacillus sp. CGMCC 1.16607]|uniref:peptidoglycan DD-metalloendopeptidase family protein n=1 Tax=Bacillus sp. CGMCC 1.16607 TaxID=3351842 RepID=UPI00363A6BDD
MSMNLFNKLSKLNKKITNIKLSNIKKVAFTSLFATSIAFGYSSNSLAGAGLTTVYYVYLNNEYIGTISNKNVLNKVVEDKVEQLKEVYKNKDIAVGSQLSYIPEQVFRSTANDQSVIDKIQNDLKPLADAAAVVIGDKSAVYLENEKMAQEVVQSLKLQYVSKEQLEELEARQKSPNVSLVPLKENESRLLDVSFSENVSVKKEKITPDKIFTVVEALKYIKKGTLEEVKYKVQDGDVLGTIASDHNLKLEQLLNLNPGLTEDSVIKIDQELNVTVPKPLVRVMVEKEVYLKEEIPFERQVRENADMYKGDTKVQQEGKVGLRAVNYVVSEQNGKPVKKQVIKEDVLVAPFNHIVLKGTKVIPSRGEGSFSWPTSGGYISSNMGYRWNKMHKGIDIARPSNYTIKAADNGIVVFAGWDGGYGKKVVVDHQNGYRTVYAHLSAIDVNVGQTVPKGSALGQMGSTGDSTGTHLHFEVYRNGALVNPLNYIK